MIVVIYHRPRDSFSANSIFNSPFPSLFPYPYRDLMLDQVLRVHPEKKEIVAREDLLVHLEDQETGSSWRPRSPFLCLKVSRTRDMVSTQSIIGNPHPPM